MNRSSKIDLPVEEFFGWLPLGALLVMALNDHVLRLCFPGAVTGKVSDLAVLLFFPSLLTAVFDTVLFLAHHAARALSGGRLSVPYRLTRWKVAASVVLSGLLLAGINLSPVLHDGLLGAMARLDVLDLFEGFRYTMDPTDLAALAVLPVSLCWGLRAVRRQELHRTGPP
jgi:hypothetical protein